MTNRNDHQYIDVTRSNDRLDSTTIASRLRRLRVPERTDPTYPWQVPNQARFEVLLVSDHASSSPI